MISSEFIASTYYVELAKLLEMGAPTGQCNDELTCGLGNWNVKYSFLSQVELYLR
jgi:hypothetical protein